MISPQLEQFASQVPMHLQNTDTRTVMKFAAARESARKAYLRTIYGFQPANGKYVGYIQSAVTHGSVVTVGIYFLSDSPTVGVFELPLHVFKKDGKPVTSSHAIQSLVLRGVTITMADRYKFNGISLSNVTAIEFDSKFEPVRVIDARHNGVA
jgi:hypothetical protein